MPGDAGTGDLNADAIPLGRETEQLGVFRWVRGEDGEGWSLQPQMNIVVTNITIREDANPPVATFRYRFDPNFLPDNFPTRFEHAYGNPPDREEVLHVDDRLCVIRDLGDGEFLYVFDGFVTQPQAIVDGNSETVVVTAMGTPFREWDFVLPGALWQDENEKTKASWHYTEMVARFNPLGKENAQPENDIDDEEDTPQIKGEYYFTDEGETAYPFTSVDDPEDATNPKAQKWTLAMAVRYCVLVGIEHPLGLQDAPKLRDEATEYPLPFVEVPDFNDLSDLLKAIVPKDDGGPIDLDDPDTYDKVNIICPDVEVTGVSWPEAVSRLIRPFGFHFRFDIEVDNETGLPYWIMTFYREDDDKLTTTVRLQEARDDLDPGKTNVGSIRMARDAVHIANEFEIDTALVEYEATFLLAPGFEIAAGDLEHASDFLDGGDGDANRLKYRRFIFGEDGAEWWDAKNKTMTADDFFRKRAFRNLFAIEADELPDLDDFDFLVRKRKPIGELLSKMKDGQPYRYQLHVSDYKNFRKGADGTPPTILDYPALWGGDGKWQLVSSTEYKLLDDRMGIQFTCFDPNNFSAGNPQKHDEKPLTEVFEDSNGLLNMIEWLSDGNRGIIFALTCVIQFDHDIDLVLPRRDSSLTNFRIRRKLDQRDRWKKQVATKYSMMAKDVAPDKFKDDKGNLKDFYYVRDDTKAAKNIMQGYQRSHESGSHAGNFTIPRFSTAYNVGMTVKSIDGRDVNMQINSGAGQGETPRYARIQSIAWTCEGQQTTTPTLTDERADPMARRTALQARLHHGRAHGGGH